MSRELTAAVVITDDGELALRMGDRLYVLSELMAIELAEALTRRAAERLREQSMGDA